MRKPSIQTKAGNYLLRSTRSDNLLDLMALVHADRVAVDGFGVPATHKADGTWAGHCAWGVEMLEARELIRLVPADRRGRRRYELTTAGYQALDGALVALDRRIDTAALLARIDATRVY